MKTEFSTVTELPGSRATAEQLSMLATRYEFARPHCRGKEVLEVACGSGIGLGYLARDAKRVIGGDVDQRILRIPRHYYRDRANVDVVEIDAHRLVFPDDALDTVILFEAIYYLADPKQFFREAFRVLRPGGKLVICSVNCQWHGFNASPYSSRYFTASELAELQREAGFEPTLFGAFPDVSDTVKRRAIARLRHLAARLRLFPRTMRGKELLKRIFYGRLTSLGNELVDSLAEAAPLVELSDDVPASRFKVLYSVAGSQKAVARESAAA